MQTQIENAKNAVTNAKNSIATAQTALDTAGVSVNNAKTTLDDKQNTYNINKQLFDAGGQLLCSSCRFAVHSLLSGLGAVFQPLVPLVLFWRGMGFGALGVCSYAAGQPSHSLYYLLVLLPRALGEVLLLDLCGRMCAAFFQPLFLCYSFQKEVSEQTPIRQTPQGGLLGYLLRYLIFYFLGGSVALLSSLLEFAFR